MGIEFMHGLIFVTWEKYLAERFGGALLNSYRMVIGETPTSSPLADRVYDDATLLAGVSAASKLTGVTADVLLHEYGYYFIINGLTSHLCAYLLRQVNSGRDLLLTMRTAHAQMRRTPDALTPPLFDYEVLSNDSKGFVLIYDSPRKLCSVLHGAIEGAAQRYGERVQILEHTCMKRGDATCRFDIRFSRAASGPLQQQANIMQQQFTQFVLSILPTRQEQGVTLVELQQMLQTRYGHIDTNLARPSKLLEALKHLQHAGLVSSTANQPGDNLQVRRYWRAPTAD